MAVYILSYHNTAVFVASRLDRMRPLSCLNMRLSVPGDTVHACHARGGRHASGGTTSKRDTSVAPRTIYAFRIGDKDAVSVVSEKGCVLPGSLVAGRLAIVGLLGFPVHASQAHSISKQSR